MLLSTRPTTDTRPCRFKLKWRSSFDLSTRAFRRVAATPSAIDRRKAVSVAKVLLVQTATTSTTASWKQPQLRELESRSLVQPCNRFAPTMAHAQIWLMGSVVCVQMGSQGISASMICGASPAKRQNASTTEFACLRQTESSADVRLASKERSARRTWMTVEKKAVYKELVRTE